MSLIAEVDRHYRLGVEDMDQVHREFADLVNALEQADKPAFAAGFGRLLAHTEAHFAAEEARMAASAFPATAEHRADHQRVLGDLHRFARQVARGRTAMARAYLREQIPAWFSLHAATMDSALAAHLKATRSRDAEA